MLMGSLLDEKPIISREQYIESVGCTFQPELREMVEPHVREGLKDYFEAQDKWGEAVLKAADAEMQFIDLTGKPSRNRKRIVGGGILGGDSLGQYEGYGTTKYGEKAEDLEPVLRDCAEDIAEHNEGISRTEIEHAVWTSLGGVRNFHRGHEQLDLLGEAAEAMRLIEKANEVSNNPILMINKRISEGSDEASSSIIIGDSFELTGNDGKLNVIINNPTKLTFERRQGVSYGGTRGLIGSARFDTVWRNIPPSSLEIEYDQVVLGDILKLDPYAKRAANFLLKKLAGESEDLFVQIDFGEHDNNCFVRHHSSGRDDSLNGKFDNKKGIYIGEDVDSIIEQIISTEIQEMKSSNWSSNLIQAFKAIESERDKKSKKSLFGKIASATRIEDFYS